MICQQTQRWIKAGVFETMVHDLEVTGKTVEVAFVDGSYTGEKTAQAVEGEVIHLEVIKLPDVKKRLCLAAPPLGSRAQFWLGSAYSPAGAGLRTPAGNPDWLIFLGFYHPDGQTCGRNYSHRSQFITPLLL